MMLVESIALAITALVGVLLAAVAHELTHMLWALPVAQRAEYRLPEHQVEVVVRDDKWRQRWVSVAGVSPMLMGVLGLILALHFGVAIPLTLDPQSLAVWAPWLVYAIGGGWADYLPARGKPATTADD